METNKKAKLLTVGRVLLGLALFATLYLLVPLHELENGFWRGDGKHPRTLLFFFAQTLFSGLALGLGGGIAAAWKNKSPDGRARLTYRVCGLLWANFAVFFTAYALNFARADNDYMKGAIYAAVISYWPMLLCLFGTILALAFYLRKNYSGEARRGISFDKTGVTVPYKSMIAALCAIIGVAAIVFVTWNFSMVAATPETFSVYYIGVLLLVFGCSIAISLPKYAMYAVKQRQRIPVLRALALLLLLCSTVLPLCQFWGVNMSKIMRDMKLDTPTSYFLPFVPYFLCTIAAEALLLVLTFLPWAGHARKKRSVSMG